VGRDHPAPASLPAPGGVSIHDLSDGELRARLLARGMAADIVAGMLAHRDAPDIAAVLARLLDDEDPSER
jgi:hypothetical protein